MSNEPAQVPMSPQCPSVKHSGGRLVVVTATRNCLETAMTVPGGGHETLGVTHKGEPLVLTS